MLEENIEKLNLKKDIEEILKEIYRGEITC